MTRAVLEDARDRHRQGRGDQQRDGQQVDQPHHRVGGDEEHDRRQRHAGADRDPVAALDPVAGRRVGDGHDQRRGRQDRAPQRAPPLVVHQLQQQEVRQEQREQAGVAVEKANDVRAGRASR